jgi:hypothetical protein
MTRMLGLSVLALESLLEGATPLRAPVEYWQRLDDVIQREPVEPRDIFFPEQRKVLSLRRWQPIRTARVGRRIRLDVASATRSHGRVVSDPSRT